MEATVGKLAIIFVLCTVCFQVSMADFETDLKYIRICNKTAPISMRIMNEVLISKKLPSSTVALGNFKCFLYCLFKHYGWMDEIGGFELNTIHHNLAETGSIGTKAMNHIMYGCTALEEMNKCERAFQFIQCFWEKSTAEENTDDDKFFYALDEQDQNMLIR
ncbi:uncharacterized protein [Atheta coriaria]|uniref:uncharacterized protein n=1 Tax=Dalotia coriaria TaxID=877792 RepID=UPI0031F34A8F